MQFIVDLEPDGMPKARDPLGSRVSRLDQLKKVTASPNIYETAAASTAGDGDLVELCSCLRFQRGQRTIMNRESGGKVNAGSNISP
jgi:hypothetical protein